MRITLGAVLISSLALSSCGMWRDSGMNPSNWFGRSQDAGVEMADAEIVNPLIPEKEDKIKINAKPDVEDMSVPIERITDMSIAQTPTGAIVTVTGMAARVGAYNAKLVPIEDTSDAQLVYTFRVDYPEAATIQGTEATRSITAAVSLSNKELRGIRLIRVEGAENARESRR